MEIFYSDKEKTFKCSISIEGASLEDTFGRLLLEFDNGTINLYKGKIDKSGKCVIKIPALKNAPSDKGKATLEIIADSTYFESWEGEFEIKRHKNVEVSVDETEDEEKEMKPIVTVDKVTISEEISFTDFYKKFKKNKIEETSAFKNYKPTTEAKKILKEHNIKNNDPISKTFMYYLDREII